MENIIVPIPENCSGCMTCMLFCSWTKEKKVNPRKSRIKILDNPKEGFSVPVICMQCTEPSCVSVCPVNAISKDPKTGTMLIDASICTNCRLCIDACPYGAIRVDPETDALLLCDLCGGDPQCIKFCRMEAIKWVPKTEENITLRSSATKKIQDFKKTKK